MVEFDQFFFLLGERMPKRPGRPELPAKERRSETVKFTARKELRDRLEAAAQRSGRSLSDEVQHRLERSFETDEALGSPDNVQMFHSIAAGAARLRKAKKGEPMLVPQMMALASASAFAAAGQWADDLLYVTVASGTDPKHPTYESTTSAEKWSDEGPLKMGVVRVREGELVYDMDIFEGTLKKGKVQ